MSGLAALLAGHEAAGVWRWESALDPADVARAAEVAGWSFGHVDGWTDATTKAGFLAAVGVALSFPDHYGHNLDALVDSLRDVGGRADVLLLWDGWSTLAREDSRTFGVVLEILDERSRSIEPTRFAVLLRGEGPDLEGVPLLS